MQSASADPSKWSRLPKSLLPLKFCDDTILELLTDVRKAQKQLCGQDVTSCTQVDFMRASNRHAPRNAEERNMRSKIR